MSGPSHCAGELSVRPALQSASQQPSPSPAPQTEALGAVGSWWDPRLYSESCVAWRPDGGRCRVLRSSHRRVQPRRQAQRGGGELVGPQTLHPESCVAWRPDGGRSGLFVLRKA